MLRKTSTEALLDPLPGSGEAEAYSAEQERVLMHLAKSDFKLTDLSQEDLVWLGKSFVFDQYKKKLEQEVNLRKLNYDQERTLWLDSVSPTGSPETRRTYETSLGKLEAFCRKRQVEVLLLSAALADEFVYEMRYQKLSSATINKTVGAVSSFYGWLGRRYPWVENPIYKTQAKPALHSVRTYHYPDAQGVATILENTDNYHKAVIATLAWRGLRIGALPSLSLRGNRFKALSKGKEISGYFPDSVRCLIQNAGLALSEPFAGVSAHTLLLRVKALTTRLKSEGRISYPWSAHDFRHYFAITEYTKDHDLYRVKELLSHSSVRMTEVYLRGLGCVDAQGRPILSSL